MASEHCVRARIAGSWDRFAISSARSRTGTALSHRSVPTYWRPIPYSSSARMGSSPGNSLSATISPCSSRSATTNFRPGGAATLRRKPRNSLVAVAWASCTRASSRCRRASRACQAMAALPATTAARARAASRHASAVPADELGRAVPDRVGPRADGLVVEVAPDVGGEGVDGDVALDRVLLQGLCGDRVEIAAKLPAKAVRGRRARGGVGIRRRLGETFRVGLEDRLDEQGRRRPRRPGRMLAGEQKVEQTCRARRRRWRS